jgi:hypothetical protein
VLVRPGPIETGVHRDCAERRRVLPMAIVTGFSQVTKDRVGRPKTTECGFCAVEVDGTHYLLLETYGAADREIPGKVSQSLHLDRERAAELKGLLDNSFPGI